MKHLDDHISIARELCYPDEVIQRLYKAKTLEERTQIMTDARQKLKDYIPDTLRKEGYDDQT